MGYKLVLADHSVTIRLAVEMIFRDLKLEIIPVNGPQELEAVLRTNRPEVLLLDRAFLGSDFESEFAGISSLVERLGVYTLLMAKVDDEISIEQIREWGITDFCLKPLDDKELRSKVGRFLEHREQALQEVEVDMPAPPDLPAATVAAPAAALDLGALAEELGQKLKALQVLGDGSGGGIQTEEILRRLDGLEERIAGIAAPPSGEPVGELLGPALGQLREDLLQAMAESRVADQAETPDQAELGRVLEENLKTELGALLEGMEERLAAVGASANLAADAVGRELDARLPSAVDELSGVVREAAQGTGDQALDRLKELLGTALEESLQKSSDNFKESLEESLVNQSVTIQELIQERLTSQEDTLVEKLGPQVANAARESLTQDLSELTQELQNLHREALSNLTETMLAKLEEEIQAEAILKLETALSDLGPAVQQGLQAGIEPVLEQTMGPDGEKLAQRIVEGILTGMDLSGLAEAVQATIRESVLELVPEHAVPLIREAIDQITSPEESA